MQPIPGLDPNPQPRPRRRVTAGIQVQDGGGWRVIIGLLIVGYGLLLTAANFNNDRAYWVLERWYFPLAMIAIGVYRSWRACTALGRAIGGFITLIGIWWVICEALGIRFNIWDWWPLALVGFGAVMIYRATIGRDESTVTSAADTASDSTSASFSATPGGAAASATADGTSTAVPGGAPPLADAGPISAFAFWSGVHKRVSAAFRRASLAAVMGGIEFDLRPAVTVGGQAVIEVFVLMGGLEITVPPDWTVTNEALVIMGGIDDRSSGAPGATQRLVIRGFILMGGVEIKT